MRVEGQFHPAGKTIVLHLEIEDKLCLAPKLGRGAGFFVTARLSIFFLPIAKCT